MKGYSWQGFLQESFRPLPFEAGLTRLGAVMSKKDLNSEAADLRRRAEKQLEEKQKTQGVEVGDQMTAAEKERLLQELQVNKIELEIQNEELRQARTELETGLAKYSNLYDFAPVGYFTLDRSGTILRANFTGALLLGMERGRMINQHFRLFVSEADRTAFSEFLKKVFESKVKETCEIALRKEEKYPPPSELSGRKYLGETSQFVHIEATTTEDGKECLAVVVDITSSKRAGALQSAIFNSANFSSIATDAKGVIQIFNVGAERMLGYTAAEVMNKITPADISDPQEVIARAKV